jgi:alpha/beta superfamily hydrolase
MSERPVNFPAEDGVLLEGLLDDEGEKGVLILLHPHPLYGGEMHNPVIKTMKKTASEEGFSTLRFNFRGVGGSQGSYGEGVKERSDVKGALNFLLSLNLKRPYLVGGYSFGSIVGTEVGMEDDRIDGLILVSPPLFMSDFSLLLNFKKPKLIIAGDRDYLCPVESLKGLYEKLPDPKMLHIIEACDHFYSWGMHKAIAKPVRDFLRNYFSTDVP